MTEEMMELLKIFNSQAERDTVLLAIKECQEKHDVMRKQGLDRQSRKSIKQEIKKLETEYKSRLPIQSLSVCPFCGATFQLEMDPFGYAGDWWADRPLIKNQCPHYIGWCSRAGRSRS